MQRSSAANSPIEPGALLAAALCLVALSTGCAPSPYELAPVSGTVRIDGQPLGVGKVMFAPVSTTESVESGKPGIGQLQPDGTFSLSTYKPGDGAVVGSHWVTIYGPGKRATGLPADVPPFERLTVRDGAKEVVAGQHNHFDINIPSEQIRQFAARPE